MPCTILTCVISMISLCMSPDHIMHGLVWIYTRICSLSTQTTRENPRLIKCYPVFHLKHNTSWSITKIKSQSDWRLGLNFIWASRNLTRKANLTLYKSNYMFICNRSLIKRFHKYWRLNVYNKWKNNTDHM